MVINSTPVPPRGSFPRAGHVCVSGIREVKVGGFLCTPGELLPTLWALRGTGTPQRRRPVTPDHTPVPRVREVGGLGGEGSSTSGHSFGVSVHEGDGECLGSGAPLSLPCPPPPFCPLSAPGVGGDSGTNGDCGGSSKRYPLILWGGGANKARLI